MSNTVNSPATQDSVNKLQSSVDSLTNLVKDLNVKVDECNKKLNTIDIVVKRIQNSEIT